MESTKKQSAQKSCHSTELSLLRVENNILLAIYNRKAVLLVLLDLSVDFDTVDNDIAFRTLESLLGLRGKPLPWFCSYLTARSQCVSVESCFCFFRVPQGSVLGPVLFIT